MTQADLTEIGRPCLHERGTPLHLSGLSLDRKISLSRRNQCVFILLHLLLFGGWLLVAHGQRAAVKASPPTSLRQKEPLPEEAVLPVPILDPAPLKAFTPVSSRERIEPLKEATVFIEIGSGQLKASGTGFVVRTKGETVFVATSRHVVDLSEEETEANRPSLIQSQTQTQPVVTVHFRSGAGRGLEQSRQAETVAMSSRDENDLAILKVDGVRNPPRPLDLAGDVNPFETMPILVSGFPFGRIDRMLGRETETNPAVTINRGAVSSLRKDKDDRVRRIQIDAFLNPGHSGGPVVDEEGRVIGLVTTQVGPSVAFAVPASALTQLLDDRMARAADFDRTDDQAVRQTNWNASGSRTMSLAARRPSAFDGLKPLRPADITGGRLIDPDGDCRLRLLDATALIEIPPGVHALSSETGSNNAPMLLEEIGGDFTAQVRLSDLPHPGHVPAAPGSEHSPLASNLHSAGLILFQDPLHYLRLVRVARVKAGQRRVHREVLLEVVNGAEPVGCVTLSVDDGDLDLRIVRIGGVIECFYGRNGKRWSQVRMLACPFTDKVRVGLIASSISKKFMAARFDDFVLLVQSEGTR